MFTPRFTSSSSYTIYTFNLVIKFLQPFYSNIINKLARIVVLSRIDTPECTYEACHNHECIYFIPAGLNVGCFYAVSTLLNRMIIDYYPVSPVQSYLPFWLSSSLLLWMRHALSDVETSHHPFRQYKVSVLTQRNPCHIVKILSFEGLFFLAGFNFHWWFQIDLLYCLVLNTFCPELSLNKLSL